VIEIFRDQDDLKVVIARLISGGLTVQQIADFLGTDYFSVYRTIRKIKSEISEGVKLRRGRRRAVVEQKIEFPPKSGRRVSDEKVRAAKKLLMSSDCGPGEIAKRVGLQSPFVVYKIRNEMQRKAERRAGEFQPKQERRVCEVHGPVTVWPCVACAAERAMQEKRKLKV
jgi:transposase-like protein